MFSRVLSLSNSPRVMSGWLGRRAAGPGQGAAGLVRCGHRLLPARGGVRHWQLRRVHRAQVRHRVRNYVYGLGQLISKLLVWLQCFSSLRMSWLDPTLYNSILTICLGNICRGLLHNTAFFHPRRKCNVKLSRNAMMLKFYLKQL